MLPDTYLALVVSVAAFIVCGLFFPLFPLDGSDPSRNRPSLEADEKGGDAPALVGVSSLTEIAEQQARPAPERPLGQIHSCERNNTTYFMTPDKIRSIKADGHYTKIYDGAAHVFVRGRSPSWREY